MQGETKDINLEHLDQSAERIIKLVDQEVEDLNGDYGKIVVGGFSQGACVAYSTFLKIKHKIGAIVALSGHTPPIKTELLDEDKFQIPIFR